MHGPIWGETEPQAAHTIQEEEGNTLSVPTALPNPTLNPKHIIQPDTCRSPKYENTDEIRQAQYSTAVGEMPWTCSDSPLGPAIRGVFLSSRLPKNRRATGPEIGGCVLTDFPRPCQLRLSRRCLWRWRLGHSGGCTCRCSLAPCAATSSFLGQWDPGDSQIPQMVRALQLRILRALPSSQDFPPRPG